MPLLKIQSPFGPGQIVEVSPQNDVVDRPQTVLPLPLRLRPSLAPRRLRRRSHDPCYRRRRLSSGTRGGSRCCRRSSRGRCWAEGGAGIEEAGQHGYVGYHHLPDKTGGGREKGGGFAHRVTDIGLLWPSCCWHVVISWEFYVPRKIVSCGTTSRLETRPGVFACSFQVRTDEPCHISSQQQPIPTHASCLLPALA